MVMVSEHTIDVVALFKLYLYEPLVLCIVTLFFKKVYSVHGMLRNLFKLELVSSYQNFKQNPSWVYYIYI